MFRFMQYHSLPPPQQIAPSPPVSTPPGESESWELQPYSGTPEPIPDELRDVAPLLYGFEFTDDDLAAYERCHGLSETTGQMERFTQKLVLLAKHAEELDIRMHAFFYPGAGCRVPCTPNGSREDIVYFVSRARDGEIVELLCPTADRVKLLGEALCLSRPVRWIPV